MTINGGHTVGVTKNKIINATNHYPLFKANTLNLFFKNEA